MTHLRLSSAVSLPLNEIELSPIRAQGAGGQNVNKVSSAIHLRFDIRASSLPSRYKEALFRLPDQRMTKDGVIIIKAQQYRSQEQNRAAALERLREIIQRAVAPRKARKATRPTLGSKKRRLETKTRRAKVKTLRGKVSPD